MRSLRLVRGHKHLNRTLVRAVVNSRGRPPMMQLVRPTKEAVIVTTGVEDQRIFGSERTRSVTYARHLLMHALYDIARIPVADIGRLFHRDHSTVLEAIRRISIETRTRPQTALDVRRVRSIVQGEAA